MSKQATSHHKQASATAAPPTADLTGRAFEAWIHGGEAYVRAWLAWQQEVLCFFGSRLRWDGQVSAALSKCRTLSEVAEVQQDWAISTARDYLDEINRLMVAGARLVPSWMPDAAPRPDASHRVD